MQDGSLTTQVVTNDHDAKKRRFSFEQSLANIAVFENTFIIAYLDCGRTRVNSLEKGFKSGRYDDKTVNLFIVFACKPGDGVYS